MNYRPLRTPHIMALALMAQPCHELPSSIFHAVLAQHPGSYVGSRLPAAFRPGTGPPTSGPVSEDAPSNLPLSPYASSKSAAVNGAEILGHWGDLFENPVEFVVESTPQSTGVTSIVYGPVSPPGLNITA